MEKFTVNKICLDSDSVGDCLKNARQEKGLSLNEAASGLNIRKAYLAALEGGRFDRLPSGLYRKSFLRRYASFLEVNPEALIETLRQEPETVPVNQQQDPFYRKQAGNFSFFSIPKIAKNVLVTCLLVVCLVYLGVYLKNVISPPELSIIEPRQNLVTGNNFIEVAGYTEPEAEVMINGDMVLTGPDGHFARRVNLKNGMNTISITARRKYSQKNQIIKKILVNGSLAG